MRPFSLMAVEPRSGASRVRVMTPAALAVVAGALLVGSTVARAADPPASTGPDISSAQADAYNGPKARIAVKDFEDKMSSRGAYRPEYGRGLSDMLTTALFQTNRYIVLEREKLAGVIDELKLGTSDLARKEATVPLGELEGADLIVTAAITGFDPGLSGIGSQVGGDLGGLFGAAGRVIGSIAGGLGRAKIAMDLRMIDVRTSRVVAATHSEGSAMTFSAGVGSAGGGMSGGLSGFAKTAMETAIREMIGNSVAFVISKTPENYYRFGAVGAAAPPAPINALTVAAPAPVPGRKALQIVKADVDADLLIHLDEVTLRGVILSVVVSFSLSGNKAESAPFEVNASRTHVMDYGTGQTYPLITLEGVASGRVKAGEVKKLRLTFKAPKDVATVGINVSGVGSFDDVKLAR